MNHVTLPVTNVERSIAFYRQLGLVPIVKSLPKYARFECPDGGATFSLELSEDPPGQPGAIVCFESPDLDGTVDRLRARGVVFEQEPRDQPWLWREAYVRDPDGHRICLYHAGQNRRFPPWRLPVESDALEEG